MIDDSKFKTIPNLKWLPWIGTNYGSPDIDRKILIIGESHYHNSTPDSIRRVNAELFTRQIVEDVAINRNYYDTQIFLNLHKALFRNDEFDSSRFWNLVSFYNFIQRPMDTSKGRPNNIDFYNSWLPFLEIIKLLKPKTCLFIGTTAANTLTKALQNTNFSTTGVSWEEYIGKACAKSAIIKDQDGSETQLVFIRHTSQRFSWIKWNVYLQKRLYVELNWFEEQLKKI